MKESRLNQEQLDEVEKLLTVELPDDLEDVAGRQLDDPNRPGAFIRIPLGVRAVLPAIKRIAAMFGVELKPPNLQDLINRVQSSNLPIWVKAAILAGLYYIQSHPEIIPIFS